MAVLSQEWKGIASDLVIVPPPKNVHPAQTFKEKVISRSKDFPFYKCPDAYQRNENKMLV